MYLAAYHFDGDPATLLDGYERLRGRVPLGPSDLQLCVSGRRGIVVVDACPSREVFESFSVSPEFRAALTEVGLPQPRVEGLGELHASHVGTALVRR